MNFRVPAFLLFIAIFSGVCLADNFFNGYLNIALDKNSISAGEKLSGKFIVGNSDLANFYDGEVIAEIVSGGASGLGYPSQFDDNGIIFIERKFPFKLATSNRLEIPFEIELPKDIAEGKYAIDAYARTKISPISGAAHIFLSPVTKEFYVNAQGSAPSIAIVRTKTAFNGETGPVGALTVPGSRINGEVALSNKSNSTRTIEVWAGLCPWDDTACEVFLSEDKKTISLAPNSEASALISLQAPSVQNAYAIRLEARENGSLVSLYRNRIIIQGPSAKIKQLWLSTPNLRVGKKTTFHLLLGSSPDHYTKPDFRDFDVQLWIEKNGNRLFEKDEHIVSLPSDEVERKIAIDYIPQKDEDSFTVCSEIVKAGISYDKYCYDVVPLQDNRSGRGRVDFDAKFVPASSELKVRLCGFDAKGVAQGIDATLSLVDAVTGSEIRTEDVQTQDCFDSQIPVERKKYLLVLDDIKNNSRQSREFGLEPNQTTCSSLGGTLCAISESCSGNSKNSDEGACCIGQCIAKSNVNVEDLNGQNPPIPWIYVIAGIIVVLILVLVIVSGKKEGKYET